MLQLQKHILRIVLLTGILVSTLACRSEEVKDEHAGHAKYGMVGAAEHNVIQLDERMRLLANIATDTVRKELMGEELTILGTLTVDENKTEVVSARVNGRVDRLFVRNPGDKIRKGQALYAIYSEPLLIAETEYLHALDATQENTDPTIKQLLDRARKRLQLWGLTEKQINTLAATRKVDPEMTFYSPVSGYLTGLRVREGEYIAEGAALFEITNLSTVWVEAQVYPNELQYLNSATPAEIEFEALPDKVFKGVPVFRSPALEKNSKVYLMRYKIENVTQDLKPGMMAYVHLSSVGKRILSIPKSALVLSNETSVWVETLKGHFEMRMVRTGVETKKRVEVLSGVKQGEVVVTSGAYLLNSKNIIDKGASHTMPGM